ncbi:uncharacterized protein LOC129584741 [Paramacrobiotus metropolitanus]|uniref:uncharacterized protein LOC129584741 n=1 Tax=Paramacrobiotus metropolitanus TaxID=2943436 RepID=UPI00244566F3|nr:uncharacterized protein LOC129584741 [Paramacrobiotus metropolitanus]
MFGRSRCKIQYMLCLLMFIVALREVLCLRCYNCMNVWMKEKVTHKDGSISWGSTRESNPDCGKGRDQKYVQCDETYGPYKQYCATSVLIQYHDQIAILKKIRRNCPTRSVRDKWMYNLHARNGCTPFRTHQVMEGTHQPAHNLTISIKERYCFCPSDYCNAASKDQLAD